MRNTHFQLFFNSEKGIMQTNIQLLVFFAHFKHTVKIYNHPLVYIHINNHPLVYIHINNHPLAYININLFALFKHKFTHKIKHKIITHYYVYI